ncbi:MAG: hypothetical protein Q8O92_07945 [Candidatus Latescibacter sp.]|nr:hypothetical protein [Candidatus Latescibacter sp.]
MTDFLFSMPSFIGGMASVLDLGSTLTVYNESPTPEMADAIAIYNDWKTIGNDMRSVFCQIKESQDGETQARLTGTK